jgi:hypothetical protein
MRAVSLALALALPSVALASGCGGDDDDGVANEDIIRLNDASEEVVLTLQDLVRRGEVTTDDEFAARLISPEDGAQLAADAPPTFEWSPREDTARHGRTTGPFVWLNIAGPGMDTPIDVVALESTTWTPEEEHWEILRNSTGPCEVKVVSAYVDDGIVEEAFRPSSNPSFSVTE